LGDEHKTVMISIIATIVAAFLLFLVTIAVAGGVSTTLFMSYVLPLLMSAFTLSVFWAFLFARHKGILPILAEEEAKAEKAQTDTKPS
jgi:ABC-type sugar transport system permease subunit